MTINDLSRRDFLRLSALASAGLTIPGGASLLYAQQDLEKKNFLEDKMSYIPFGRTKMLVSRLAIGSTVWDNNVAQAALAGGVKLFRSAVDYGGGRPLPQVGS